MSPRVVSTYEIGLGEVVVSYGQPSQRGRKLYGTGGVIPYSTLWRTGANAATKLTFSENVTIEGIELLKGEYAVLSEIDADKWTVMLYNYTKSSWSAYVSETPKLKVSLPHTVMHDNAESLNIGVSHVNLDRGKLYIQWGKRKVEMDIVADSHSKVMKNIEKTVQGTSSNEYFLAALYLHEKNIELETALKYIRKVTSSESALFFHFYREAVILKDLGREDEMKAAASRALASARQAGNDDFIRLNEALLNNSN